MHPTLSTKLQRFLQALPPDSDPEQLACDFFSVTYKFKSKQNQASNTNQESKQTLVKNETDSATPTDSHYTTLLTQLLQEMAKVNNFELDSLIQTIIMTHIYSNTGAQTVKKMYVCILQILTNIVQTIYTKYIKKLVMLLVSSCSLLIKKNCSIIGS